MPKKLYSLTVEDEKIFELAKTNGSMYTAAYVRSFDQPSGWYFDRNISEPWQKEFNHSPQSDIMVIAGFGSGKTITVGMSALVHAGTIAGFKFLNVAPTAWQSKQMFDVVLATVAGTLFAEKFLYKYVERPYPKITLKYKTRAGKTVTSTLEFMSASDDAQNIRTWEGDWCNVDQAELIDNLLELWANLGTRTRGIRADGKERLGRLSAIANADDNPELWALAGLAEDYPDTNRFFSVKTSSNKNISESQMASFKRRLGNDPERIKQYLDAKQPMGKGKEFSRELVEGCLDRGLDKIMKHNAEKETVGFEFGAIREAGTILWAMPHEKDRVYVVVGDIGQGHAPLRNAPVVMVFDVTDFPNSACVLRAFWWGDGAGSYQPWINQFLHWRSHYKCVNGAFDATGGQKVFSETTFEHIVNVVPIDLSNVKKRACMVTLKIVMMKKLLRIPGEITGLTSQLLKYRIPDEKIPQDIVSTLFILAGYLRAMGYEIPDDQGDSEDVEITPTLENRYSRQLRNRQTRQPVRGF